MTTVTKSGWYLSVVATCVDRVAERLARQDFDEATKSPDDSDEEDGAASRGRKSRPSRSAKGASQRRPDSAGQGAGGDPLQRHHASDSSNKQGKAAKMGARRKRKSSIFDVTSLPANLDELAEEETQMRRERVAAGKDPRGGFTRQADQPHCIHSQDESLLAVPVTGTQIRRMFCDQPAMLRSFMRKGWRLGAKLIAVRLVRMLELIESHDTLEGLSETDVLVDASTSRPSMLRRHILQAGASSF